MPTFLVIVVGLGAASVFLFAVRSQQATDSAQHQEFRDCATAYVGEPLGERCQYLIASYPQKKPKLARDVADFVAQRAGVMLDRSGSDRNRLDEASAYVERALSITQKSHFALYIKALIAKKRGEIRQAERLLRNAIRLSDETQYHVMLGAVLAEQGDAPAALAAMEDAFERDATNPHIYKQRQKILSNMGDFEGALADVNELLRLGHRVEALQLRHAVLLKFDQRDDAYADIIALTQADDASALSWMFRAVFEVEDERFYDAISSATAGIAAWPDGIATDENTLHTLHLARSGAYARVGDPERAKPFIDAYLDDFGGGAPRQWQAFDMYHKAGFDDEALTVLEGMEVEDDARSRVLRMTARVHCDKGDAAMARRAFNAWFAAFPDHANVVLQDMSERHNYPPSAAGMAAFIDKNCVIADEREGDQK